MSTTRDVLSVLSEAESIIIYGDEKVGKMTLLSYMIKLLFHEKTLFFSPHDAFLIDKKLDTFAKQHIQFEDIHDYFESYLLLEGWQEKKRHYGYAFLLTELERIISSSENKIVVFHHFEDFFDFQDRYEIDGFYKSLVKIASLYHKKIIFLASTQNENYKFIQSVSDEFLDLSIILSKNTKNERIIDVKNLVTYEEYPQMQLVMRDKNFILKYRDTFDASHKRDENILVMQLSKNINKQDINMNQFYDYIFSKPTFNIYHADSLKSILNNIFIKPDIIIILMKRTKDNFETVKSIKKQLPETVIYAVIEQDFVRVEDAQEAYTYGCDELLPGTYLFNNFMLSLQKSIKNFFYVERLKDIDIESNIAPSLSIFRTLIDTCLENRIFFTCFVIKRDVHFDGLESSMRKYDFIYKSKDKIYYLALNTMPWSVDVIFESLKKNFHTNIDILTICTALDTKKLEELF
jgi:hypothetical protein